MIENSDTTYRWARLNMPFGLKCNGGAAETASDRGRKNPPSFGRSRLVPELFTAEIDTDFRTLHRSANEQRCNIDRIRSIRVMV